MAGDSFRDAWRAELDAVIAAASPSISWTRNDGLNTGTELDASTGYFEIGFTPGGETPYTFGAPGQNFHLQRGTVLIHVLCPLARSTSMRDQAERYIEQVRTAFRARRFDAGSVSVKVTGTTPAAGGETEGGMWVETISLSYELFNVG